MRKELKENPNNAANSNRTEEGEGGDSRYRARITEAQQEILDELSSFYKKYEEKEKETKKTGPLTETAEAEAAAATKPDAQRAKRKAVEISKNKSILQIITEKFVISVKALKWKKIVDQLKSLFSLAGTEEDLLKQLGDNNEAISSLLRSSKNKEKLFAQMRIAHMLKTLSGNSQLSSKELNRLLIIQKSLLSELKNISRSSTSKKLKINLSSQRQVSAIILEQKLTYPGVQRLAGLGPEKGVPWQGGAFSNINKEGAIARNISSPTGSNSSDIFNRINPSYYNMKPAMNDKELIGPALIGLLRPIEKAVILAINKAELLLISAINGAEDKLINMIGKENHNYECNNNYTIRATRISFKPPVPSTCLSGTTAQHASSAQEHHRHEHARG